jgi:putative ABC transport system permease protein
MQRTASFAEAIRIAGQSLRGSKLRSFLTLLGIILATTTLIAVMSLIHGMDLYIAQNVSDMGADGFRVVRMAFITNWDPKKYLEYLRKNPELKREEFDFLRSKTTLLRELGMQTRRRGNAKFSGERLEDVRIMGATPNIGVLTNTQVETGRFISESDGQRRVMAAVIGWDLQQRFFQGMDPLGKTIQLDGRPFVVVGVAKKKGSVFGQSQDSIAFIPIETYFRVYTAKQGIAYVAAAKDPALLNQAQDEIRMLLRAWRHVRPGDDDTFSIVSSDSLTSAWSQMTQAIAATAVAVVSVFMVVGGIVIMNIMLAAVTERTQEIGIRKSLGARGIDILNQFLVESSLLAGSGGVLGVLIAWVFVVIVRSTTPVPLAMPLSAVVLAVGVSSAVGMFFGIYPARRASKLDPIEALRVER